MDAIKTIFIVAIGNLLCFFVFSNEPQVLPKIKMKVCNVSLQMEVADDDTERQIGMMFREGVPPGTGMIFVFKQEQKLSFWMKNVPFNIDIGYFDQQGKLINTHTMLGTSILMKDNVLPNYPSDRPAKYAVEVAEGFFKNKKHTPCKLSPLLK